MDIRFDGKKVLISGATGSLGRKLAEDYCASGAETLILMDKPECLQELESMKELLRAKTEVLIYTADLRKVDEIKEAVLQMERDIVRIDVLINNAGINILKKVSEMDEESWDLVLDINLKGSFFLTKYIGEMSLLEQKGNVVFISSQHGVVGNVLRTAYCSSKTGMLGLVRALTAEWSAFGVRINAVSPTYILNEKNGDFLYNPSETRKMLNKIPLHRYAAVDDIASAVLFLSSVKASMITGQNLIVDGGYTCL